MKRIGVCMQFRLSLAKKFTLILALFVAITVAVLYLLVNSYNEPINFGLQEKKGNAYQRPVEKLLQNILIHRVLAQRALLEGKDNQSGLAEIEATIDKNFDEVKQVNEQLITDLQFDEKGLASRKREHVKFENILKEWNALKTNIGTLKPTEVSDQHSHLISDLRTVIAHLGDTSNLILDPDLDSYYLMDITLLALPQTQDRIQSLIVELEPILRHKTFTEEERIKASVFVAMMKESDLGRITGDFQTVLNEDPNFYGVSPTLEPTLSPVHKKFVADYEALIQITEKIAKGEAVPLEQFIQISDTALSSSFEYWQTSANELDNLLDIRVKSYQHMKYRSVILSIIGMLLALAIAWLFMRYIVKTLRGIVDTLSRSSSEVSNASGRTATSATELSEASIEQASSLQETMASVEEISAMVSQNAESASKTQTAVNANQKSSEDGSRSVEEMIDAISEIKVTNEEILTQMKSSNKEFGEIVKIISEIGDKTNVINEIVFQTKLLSFNASVEAARAGEHGKGFAVVAEEVGNLAQMSGNAAKEITDMLSDSVKKVNSIVHDSTTRVDQLVEVGKDKVAMGQTTAERCQKALNEITESARTVTSMITEIAHASKEQAQGIQEINKAISQLDQVTQQNSAVAQQSSTQSEQLNAQATSLATAVKELVVFVEG